MTHDPKFSLTRRAALGLFGATALLPRLARAGSDPTRPVPAPLDAAQRADILRIQQYLNSIRSMQSRFEQVADDGSVAAGTIYLERPGKMRIVYDPPSPILIVATDGQIYYYDSRLQQVSRTYVNDTPAWFLLRDPITLSGDITVTGFAHSADTYRLTLVESNNADLGQVTIVLSDQPLQLRQWTVLDAQRKRVTVTLEEPAFDVALNQNLFYWTDPRPNAPP